MSIFDEDFQQKDYKYDRRKIKNQLRDGHYDAALEDSEIEADAFRRNPRKVPQLNKANKPQRKDNGKRNFLSNEGLSD